MRRVSGLTVALWALGGAAAVLMAWVVLGIVVEAAPLLGFGLWARDAATFLPLIENTLYMVGTALVVSVPLGLAAAVARTEYLPGPRGRWLQGVAALLASLPSVVVGLGLFLLLVDAWHLPVSRLTGMVALVVINLPWVAASTMSLLSAVPENLRDASLALGGTRLQTALRVVLPRALPALVSGLGVGGARMLGESAALLYTAGINAAPGAGWNLMAPGGTLAVHLFYMRTESLAPDANGVAAVTGVILLALLAVLLLLGHALAAAAARRAGIR